ncbi:hypothetical protein NE865_03405 [Phthorimaea operculella]|nr:hypothetical protein NE865_03405 [Phthorimaea operculella]
MANAVIWRPCTEDNASGLNEQSGRRPIVAGHDSDGTILWVIRGKHAGDVIPGKYRVYHKAALVPYHGGEHRVSNFEVCCADPDNVCWVQCRDGNVPPTAVQGGYTNAGEALYIGRVKKNGANTPGKVHPTHECMYIGYYFKEHKYRTYEVLCTKE